MKKFRINQFESAYVSDQVTDHVSDHDTAQVTQHVAQQVTHQVELKKNLYVQNLHILFVGRFNT
jgi:hypothetical protein